MADTDDKSDVDDFFTTDENTEQTGDMSDVFSSADGSPLDVAPSSEISTDPFALDSGSIEISDPVSASAGAADDAQGVPQEEDKKSGKKGKKAKKEKAPKSYKTVARTLTDTFGTNVKIKSVKGKNKIEIEFKDEADLERLFRIMTNPSR